MKVRHQEATATGDFHRRPRRDRDVNPKVRNEDEQAAEIETRTDASTNHREGILKVQETDRQWLETTTTDVGNVQDLIATRDVMCLQKGGNRGLLRGETTGNLSEIDQSAEVTTTTTEEIEPM